MLRMIHICLNFSSCANGTCDEFLASHTSIDGSKMQLILSACWGEL